jgi:hypothetical protein
MTAEDAYPWWLRRRIHEWIRALPDGSVEPEWEQGSRIILKPVCEKCQRRLNTVFESPASVLLKEMMDGSVIDLSPQQQVLVAGWIVKTGLVLLLERHPDGLANRLLREWLTHMLKGGTPPANATARIGYFSDNLEQSRKGFLPPGWPDVLDPREGIVSVISVPGFICETILGPAAVVRSFIDMTKDDDRFIVVWPPNVTHKWWPPPVTMGLFDSEAVREEWGHSEWYGNFPTVDTVPLLNAPAKRPAA